MEANYSQKPRCKSVMFPDKNTRDTRRRIFPLRWWLQLGCLLCLLVGIMLWRSLPQALQNSTQTLEPGLTLRKFAHQTPEGATQIYLLRGAKKAGWRLQLALAQGTVMQRETVSQIAQREKAPVAVNGGFFAYDGAALGAVKKDGEWVRLPWKNRTALGLKKDGTYRIGNLRGTIEVEINGAKYNDAALNGSAPADGLAVLTSHYGTIYRLKPGESALEVTNGKVVRLVTNGSANIRVGGFLIVARGASVSSVTKAAVDQNVAWKVQATPADWDNYPTILGAGPRLVSGGIARETSKEEEFRPDVLLRGSRTGIGLAANGDVLFVIADANDVSSPGLTLPELARLMAKEGAQEALHMDCGPSSVLIVNGQIANLPWSNQPSGLNEPTVPNALLMKR
jgi:uncharacterized protein YigE (DUF2233 family)